MPKLFNPNKPPLTLLEIGSIALAMSLIIICYFYTSPQYFQRSGALLVCIGVFFGVVDFGKQIDKTIISTLKRMLSKEENESVIFFQKQLIMQLENPITSFHDVTIKDGYQYRIFYEAIKRRIIIVEAIIAIIGTLIWAYGDLL